MLKKSGNLGTLNSGRACLNLTMGTSSTMIIRTFLHIIRIQEGEIPPGLEITNLFCRGSGIEGQQMVASFPFRLITRIEICLVRMLVSGFVDIVI